MSLLKQRSGDLGVIEGRFITAKLNETGKEMIADIRAEMRRRDFSQSKWNTNTISVSENEMKYEHIAAERFVDMKNRKSGNLRNVLRRKKSRSGNKKNHPVHNKIIFSHKRMLVRELSFGFTEEVMNSFRKIGK